MLAIMVVAALPASVHSIFNFSKCPSIHEVQNPHVPQLLDMKEYQGFYYELAFHDYLQALCPSVGCVNSNKTMHTYDDGQVYVNEDWGMQCLGKDYPQVLLNNLTDTPGYFLSYVGGGFLKAIGSVLFPNIVVDYKPGPDGWTLEFQCVDLKGHVPYIGINFYARQRTEAAYQEMYDAAVKSGIDFYFGKGLNRKWNYRRVPHGKCTNEPPAASVIV